MATRSWTLSPEGSSARPSRVLVVEDEFSTARLMEFILTKHGYAVRVAADGAEALAVAQEFAPDAVLLDLQLPDVSGLEVLRQLRAASDDRIVFVVLTAGGYEEAEAAANGFRADAYRTKPLAPSTLLHVLETLGVPPSADPVPA
jgi:DNA-binding response OmpR family regulator